MPFKHNIVMNTKEFFRTLSSHYLLLHLVAMGLVVILLCVSVAIGLGVYTHHGEGIEVPDLKGMDYDKAYTKLSDLGLTLVVSDSGYIKQMPANSILVQTPGHGQKVKQGHVIYVTINSPSSPTFALPDIVDNSSLREAEARLTAMGFQVTPPEWVAGEKDWVYGILCRGRRVSNGDRISIDYPLTLMVGKGSLDEMDEMGYADSTYTDFPGSDDDDFVEVKEPPRDY